MSLSARAGSRLLGVGVALFLLSWPGALANRNPGDSLAGGTPLVHRIKTTGRPPSGVLPHPEAGRREHRYHGLILAASSRHSVDPALVKAVIMVESGYDPKAVSEKGATGLMQLMPAIADDLGVKDLFDPAHNVNGGVKHLSDLLDQFDGSLYLALAAYHAGTERVNSRPQLPKSTQRFVKKVFGYYHYYRTVMEEEGNRA